MNRVLACRLISPWNRPLPLRLISCWIRLDLFYDNPAVLKSWRSHTSRPDDFRPDIVLRRRDAHSRVILIDAKYSASEFDAVPGNRLKEVQAYMNAFGLRYAAIMHPGGAGKPVLCLRETSDFGYRLLEIGVTPAAIQSTVDLSKLRDAILALECTLCETFPNASSFKT